MKYVYFVFRCWCNIESLYLPNRRRAASILFGLLVAAMTMTWERCLRPSIRVRSWDTILLSTSPWVFSLLGAMASSSSMKMMAGEFFSASSKAFLRLLSDSPASLLMISGPLMRKKKAPVSLATARAMSVLPVPGGPYSRIPRGGYIQNKDIYYQHLTTTTE